MISIHDDCDFIELSEENPITEFNSFSDDINDFFINDAIKYQNQFLGTTYYFKSIKEQVSVGAFSVSTDGIKLNQIPNKLKRSVPNDKRRIKSLPSILIGRIGINQKFKGTNLGNDLMDFIKNFCVLKYGKSSRFISVEAYNLDKILKFYENNEFKFIYPSEEEEIKQLKIHVEEGDKLRTRFMYFDLKPWHDKIS